MNLAIVVGAFPVLSQSFIIRMIESLHDSGANLTVYALEGFDSNALQSLAPRMSSLVESGQVKVRSATSKSLGIQTNLDKLTSLILNFLRNPVFAFRLTILGLRFRAIRHALTFRRLICDSHHDVVHAQFLTLAVSVVGVNLIDQRFKTVVSYVRGFDISRSGEVSTREFSMFLRTWGLARIVCVSKSLAELVLSRGYPASKVDVIYSGIPITKLNFTPPPHCQTGSWRFIQVGRLIEKKGYQLTLQMLARFKINDFEFHIVGEGEMLDGLHLLCKTLGLVDKVVFHGALSHAETIKQISQSNFILIPSLTGRNGDAEGIPNVAKEAMALGVICISSDHSGIPELIQHGQTGFLFREGDVNHYEEVLMSAIETYSGCDQMALDARKFVEQYFDTQQVADKLLHFYAKSTSSSVIR